MSCTDTNVLRRRRIVAAALALPLSLGFTGTAFANASGEAPRAAAAEQSADAALRVADAGKAAPAGKPVEVGPPTGVETKALPEKAADRADSKPAAAPAEKKSDAPGSAAGAASGKAAATTTGGTYVNGNANSSKNERPTAPVPGTPSQPLSNADKNGTGANPGTSCTHAYCSNGTGLPTGNGVGDGKAVGQPCAGCVGKADNKNPKGQAPNGSDHNAGYECDRNQGIGQTNPAHTGCAAGTTPPPTDVCPNLPGNQTTGPCKKDDDVKDVCPDMPGNQTTGPCKKDDDVKDDDEITFCHATGSSTNPYVTLTTSLAGAANGHHGRDHQGGRDIIPAFTYKGTTYAAQGNTALLGTGCVPGGTTTTFDQCPTMPGNQPAGTNCGGGGGNNGGGGGGGGSFDNCPDMPGNQPANTVCTVGSPNPPVSGVTPPQPATGNPPVKVPPVIVPNAANPPAVIGGPAALPATRPVQGRSVPSALPFTGTDAALLAELGLLLLIGGAGVVVAARRERTARAA